MDIAWIEEAQTVSKRSWDKLVPTIRKEGSEVIAWHLPMAANWARRKTKQFTVEGAAQARHTNQR